MTILVFVFNGGVMDLVAVSTVGPLEHLVGRWVVFLNALPFLISAFAFVFLRPVFRPASLRPENSGKSLARRATVVICAELIYLCVALVANASMGSIVVPSRSWERLVHDWHAIEEEAGFRVVLQMSYETRVLFLRKAGRDQRLRSVLEKHTPNT